MIKRANYPELDGFYKIMQSGGIFVSATFYNPETDTTTTRRVRDYDYSDCSRDEDELYYEPISQEAYKIYCDKRNIIINGSVVKVYKGRKLPIGTISNVKGFRDIKDRYGRTVATYAILDNGMSTNISNLQVYNG